MTEKPTYEELERRIQELETDDTQLEKKRVVADITEHKLAEEAPRKSEAIYRAFFQDINDAAFMHELNEQGEPGRFIDVNEAACRRLGYTREELLSMAPGDITEPAEYKRLTLWRGELQDRKNILIETIHVAKDGRNIPVESNICCINHLGKSVAMSVSRDITEQKETKQENSVSRMRLDISHRIATMPDATEKDISDFVLEKMLELSGSHIGFMGYVSPDENEMIIHNWSNSAMAECALQDKPITFPIAQAGIWGEPVRTREPIIINEYNDFHPAKNGYPKGHVKISRFMAVPVSDGDQIVAVSAVGNKAVAYQEHDPRQLMMLMESWWKQIQKIRWDKDRQTLQATMSQAQKMESIGSLAGGIAHDFNNILFPIVGLSEMMLEDFSEDTLEYKNLHQIFKAGKRGSELVQQILSFSRQSQQQLIPTHIQKVLKEVFKLCRATIPADIPITRDIQNDCRPVMADPTQIHQIAMNLITNAFHAVEPAGDTISIQLREMDVDQTADPVGDLAPGRYAMLSVSDTGTGIDPAVISKIFDPYFTTKEKGRGTGLGLATVYGIVKAYGGEITVHSDIDKGSSFHIYLPVLETSKTSDTEKQQKALPTGTENILLIDDEQPIVNLEKQILERLGYQITCFTDSVDALEAFRVDPTRFDLVITDMNMPHLNGIQLAGELIAVRLDLPIIICTGFSERIDKEKAEAMGIKGFLMKPIVNRDISQMVRKVLDENAK